MGSPALLTVGKAQGSLCLFDAKTLQFLSKEITKQVNIMSKQSKIKLLNVILGVGVVLSFTSTLLYFKSVAIAPTLDGDKGILEAVGTWFAFGSWLLWIILIVILAAKTLRKKN